MITEKKNIFELQPFLEAMNRTFKDMADITLVNGPIESAISENITTDVHSKIGMFADVSSNIGIFADVKASLVLTLDAVGAAMVAKRISGVDLELYDKLLTDTIGELLNIIVGSAQRASPIQFDFSIPVSVQGKNHEVRPPRNSSLRYNVSKFDKETVCLILSQGL